MVERARIVLLAAAGSATTAIAQQLDTRPSRVSKWRLRFAEQRLAGLVDRPRSGKPARYDEATRKRILAMLDEPPTSGVAISTRRRTPLCWRSMKNRVFKRWSGRKVGCDCPTARP